MPRSRVRRHRACALLTAVLNVILLGAAACESGRGAPAPYTVTVDLGADVAALGATDDGESDGETAAAAARRIAALGVHARPALLVALEREPEAVRVAVAELLATLAVQGDPTAGVRLAQLARDDPSAEVRAATVAALADVVDPEAVAAIEMALDDRDPAVRLAAAGSCPGVCRSDAALAALARMATGADNLGHALAARRVLAMIRGDDTRRAPAERAIRAAAEPALAPGAPATPAATVLAALLLADLGDARGEAALRDAVSVPPAPALRVHALYALGRVGGTESVAVLARSLGDRGSAVYAADALARLDERGVGGARDALDAWDGPPPSAPLPPP